MALSITIDLGGIPNFDCHTSVEVRWKDWRRAFELVVVGKGGRDAQQKIALLLHCGGMQLQDINFTFTDVPKPGEDETVYDVAIKQLDGHFTPQVNSAYERHLFRAMKQLSDKTNDQFITRLRQKGRIFEIK